MVEGLVRRRLGTINRALIHPYCQRSVRTARCSFIKLLPFLKMAYVAINRVILDDMENEKPDDAALSPFLSPPPSPPPLLTRFLTALDLKVLAVAEHEASHNHNHDAPDFTARFRELLHYYAALFDALEDDASSPGGAERHHHHHHQMQKQQQQEEEERAQVEQVVLGEEIRDALVRGAAAEPLFREWAARMEEGAGFGPGVPGCGSGNDDRGPRKELGQIQVFSDNDPRFCGVVKKVTRALFETMFSSGRLICTTTVLPYEPPLMATKEIQDLKFLWCHQKNQIFIFIGEWGKMVKSYFCIMEPLSSENTLRTFKFSSPMWKEWASVIFRAFRHAPLSDLCAEPW
ncbi:hypothetical protein PR202_ga04065 [Eleusine coracana subsp. coracana]|uniref:Uncharacterized protein n=1 Tax=Eleusine coracana subsp. coracana TaxID=191504 RepID=A0AAV5BPZ4_ELECO|nr:hypothetical protein PR202_ga04065 [Eleusine coracana subsp. coracana]